MKIKVTQEHIDKGAIGDCSLCPIALALKENGFNDFLVDSSAIFNKEHTLYMHLPFELIMWIKNFDKGKQVEPFEFDFIIQEGAYY